MLGRYYYFKSVLTRQDKWLLAAVLASLVALLLPHLLPLRATSLLESRTTIKASHYADEAAQDVQWLNKEKLHWLCRVRHERNKRMCGLSLTFQQGSDWSEAYGIRLTLAAKSKNAFFRIYLRNSLPGAEEDDAEGAQYNLMMLPIDETNHTVDIAFREFVLADWWLAAHEVPDRYAIAQFDRVTSFGVDLLNPSALGDHEAQVQELALLRPYITVRATYLSVLALWFVLLVVLSWQRKHLSRTLARQVRENLAFMRAEVVEFDERVPPFCEIPQDDLTGIYNRQGFIDYWSQASRFWTARDSMALIVVQLDDQYQAAPQQKPERDSALICVANVLKSYVRPQDKLARWHEGQFILLCPLTTQADALLLADKLRVQIGLIKIGPTGLQTITATLGVVSFSAAEPLERAYARYQSVLNKSPSAGNRVIDCGGSARE